SQGVTLKAGDNFSCEFNNLQFQFQVPPGAPYNPLTRLLLGMHNFSGSFLVEAFEDSAAQPPVFSTNVTSQAASSDFYFGPAWQDLQGMARVTMLSGSMDLTLLMGTVTTPTIDVYNQSIYVVPEPSPLGLLLVAGLPMWYLRRRPQAYHGA
ncbi:MAG TPA: PEP-CTERM sorting domain-containing protein, partial [Candidatus Sulfotelmatobacter sp.]|nr:PEP-CTERM sorting domain-containing protein [Candidatus Sulfotelmatobacter sp.]